MKASSVVSTPLWQRLARVLAPQGFEPLPAQRLWARPRPGALFDVVGLRQGRDVASAYAVFFAAWAPEMDGLAAGTAKDLRRSIRSFGAMFQLSPVAPLKNTYWWPAATLDEAQATELGRQLEALALPYFDALAAPQGRNATVTTEAVARSLLDAGLSAAGFALAGDLLWRQRGECIDLLAVELLADACFVSVSAAVWHASIAQGIDGDIPRGVTLATARPVGAQAVGGDPLDAMWFTGVSRHARAGVAEMRARVPGQALRHFAAVQTRADVLAALPEVYGPHFPRA